MPTGYSVGLSDSGTALEHTRTLAAKEEVRQMVRNSRLATIGVAIALTACASGSGRSDPAQQARTVVNVTNQNWNTIHAYVIAGGIRLSLGLVSTNRTETFTVPPDLFGSGKNLIFMALPIGGSSSYVSEATIVTPGDVVDVTVQNVLKQSFVVVR